MNQTNAKMPDDKQFDYPIYIPLAFIFMGGFIGGAILGLISSVRSIFKFNDIDSSDFFVVIIFGGFGIIFGFIPSLLMGIYVTYRRLFITNWRDYVHLYAVGTFISVIYFLCWSYMDSTEPSKFTTLWAVVNGSIGGISAVILGKIFIPKISPNTTDKPQGHL